MKSLWNPSSLGQTVQISRWCWSWNSTGDIYFSSKAIYYTNVGNKHNTKLRYCKLQCTTRMVVQQWLSKALNVFGWRKSAFDASLISKTHTVTLMRFLYLCFYATFQTQPEMGTSQSKCPTSDLRFNRVSGHIKRQNYLYYFILLIKCTWVHT